MSLQSSRQQLFAAMVDHAFGDHQTEYEREFDPLPQLATTSNYDFFGALYEIFYDERIGESITMSGVSELLRLLRAGTHPTISEYLRFHTLRHAHVSLYIFLEVIKPLPNNILTPIQLRILLKALVIAFIFREIGFSKEVYDNTFKLQYAVSRFDNLIAENTVFTDLLLKQVDNAEFIAICNTARLAIQYDKSINITSRIDPPTDLYIVNILNLFCIIERSSFITREGADLVFRGLYNERYLAHQHLTYTYDVFLEEMQDYVPSSLIDLILCTDVGKMTVSRIFNIRHFYTLLTVGRDRFKEYVKIVSTMRNNVDALPPITDKIEGIV